MQIWIIEGAERWPTTTAASFLNPERFEIETALRNDGHYWHNGKLILTLDTVQKMAGQ